MSTLAELTIFPLDKGESVSRFVAEAVKIINDSGLDHETNAMGTCFEGEYENVMLTAKKCMDEMKKHCSRVYMILKIDYREGLDNRIKSKPASIKKQLESSD